MGRILSGSDWEGLKGRGSLSWGDFLLLQARGPHNRDMVSSEGPGLCASPVLAISPKGPPVMDPSHFLGSKLAHMWGEHSEAQSLAELLETWGPPGLSEPGSHPQGMGTLHWAIMAPQRTSAGDTLLPSPLPSCRALEEAFPDHASPHSSSPAENPRNFCSSPALTQVTPVSCPLIVPLDYKLIRDRPCVFSPTGGAQSTAP